MTTLYCPHCEYNLTGLPENRCPECGNEFSRELLNARASQPIDWPSLLRTFVICPVCIWGGMIVALGATFLWDLATIINAVALIALVPTAIVLVLLMPAIWWDIIGDMQRGWQSRESTCRYGLFTQSLAVFTIWAMQVGITIGGMFFIMGGFMVLLSWWDPQSAILGPGD